jgi:hypothetical protein
MKGQKTLIVISLLLGINRGFSQSNSNDISYKKNVQFMYIISLNNTPPIVTRNAYLSPSEKDTSYVLPSSINRELCKLLKVDRFIFIKMKSSAKVLTLSQVFDAFKISNSNRKLKVKVNDDLLDNPETLLISCKEIGVVNVVRNSKLSYVHIIEKDYFENKKYIEQLKKNGEVFIQ